MNLEKNQQDYDLEFMNRIVLIREMDRDCNYLLFMDELAGLYEKISGRLKRAYIYDLENNYQDIKLFFPEKRYIQRDKKVLLVSHGLNRTGAPIVLKDMARVMMDRGFQVIILSLEDGPLRSEYNDMGCVVILQHKLSAGQYSDIEIEKEQFYVLDNLVRQCKISLFCTLVLHRLIEHYLDSPYTIYWWLHEGSITFSACGTYLPPKLTPNIRVITSCRYVEAYLKTYHMEKNLYGCLNYLFEDVGKKELPQKQEILYFACVGTIDQRKGQDLLVEAIQELPFSYLIQTDFTFIGAKNDKEIARRVEALSRHYRNVHICPVMSRKELIDKYRQVDVVVAPSRDDPMPVVLTENMCLGNIVLCSTHTGTADYIEDGVGGFVFESDNAEALKEKIMQIADSKEVLHPIRERSRSIYEYNFSRRVFEKKIMDLFDM